ncbi:SGNH/GDSL hydrolase family protein [Bacillus amyloliquefaciens]|uniref:SGNH/GDSL hydrolase family protein n=1 Tax=Bacillus amyloliquefaciens TaxID=1390 RepID=UPI0024533C6A|nr:SGNH/GDSL hydrolase family protein [Bacillus amyloliquefaciens]MDH3090435.1 SGNH/GDSL hydrolase family protein [Bacillus amyloliquefaciens]
MKLRMFSLIAGLALLLSACSVQRTGSHAEEPKTKDHIVIAAVGDSLTEGVGDPEGLGYVGKVADSLKKQGHVKTVDIKNYAVQGDKTSDLLKKLDDKKVQKSLNGADYIFFTIGGNDLMKVLRQNVMQLTVQPFQKEEKPFEKRFKAIISKIRKYNQNAELVYVSMYNPFTFTLPELKEINGVVTDWNQIAAKEMKKDPHAAAVNVEDLFSQKSGSRRISKDDDFHPNAKGYALIADRLYGIIEKQGLPAE